MRFPMLVLATAIAALACERGAPLSNSTANLEPAPAATPATPALHAGTQAKAGTLSSAVALPAIVPAPRDAIQQPGSAIQQPGSAIQPSSASPQPTAAGEEGDGEPMDDVDDEEVSATDKSGAGALTHEEAADEGRSGPIDDSEGADIELRE
jgi:hypothetical protein